MSAAPKPSGKISRGWAVMSRFARDTRSVEAVEFALLGSAFFLFVFGIFFVAVVQFWQMTLDDSVRSAARLTAIAGPTATDATFSSEVCSEFGMTAPNCTNSSDSALQFYVQSNNYYNPASGANYITPATLNANGTLSTNLNGTGVSLGLTSTTQPISSVGNLQVLLVQVAYKLPFSMPIIGGYFTENGTGALYSVVATPMEP